MKETRELSRNYMKHFTSLTKIECNLLSIAHSSFLFENRCICEKCPRYENFYHTHLYGIYEAERWGGKYIYYCPSGYIFIAIPLYDEEDVLDGGVIAGPIIMGEPEDLVGENHLEAYSEKIPQLSTANVNDAAELLYGLWLNLRSKAHQSGGQIFQQFPYELKESDESQYPLETEKKLQSLITAGDKNGAQTLLNELLGKLFFSTDGEMEIVKTRLLELIVILSRAAIEGGADVNQIFFLNQNYIEEIQKFSNLEEMSIWLANVMNRFISYVFDFSDVKHSDVIFKTVKFIKDHYNEKISLDDLANQVYLSKSYLSKIFTEEMNCNISSYINMIRVEKSRSFLLNESISLVDVAGMAGFDDQSYFTKVFKKYTGVSPGKFRESRGKQKIGG